MLFFFLPQIWYQFTTNIWNCGGKVKTVLLLFYFSMKIGETLILAHHMVLLISISMSDQVNKAEKVRLSSKLHIQRERVRCCGCSSFSYSNKCQLLLHPVHLALTFTLGIFHGLCTEILHIPYASEQKQSCNDLGQLQLQGCTDRIH